MIAMITKSWNCIGLGLLYSAEDIFQTLSWGMKIGGNGIKLTGKWQ